MFSFHKPKVYRSTAGCCICKAKSSSSRFTDSKKYEHDFIQCFQLEIPRKGEICNACVLLVKRFKRLPPGSNRHWGHVVDARVGPGLKSMTKFKKRKEEQEGGTSSVIPSVSSTSGKSMSSSVPERFCKIFKKTKKKEKKVYAVQKETSSLGGSSDEASTPPSPSESHSDEYDANDIIFDKKFFNFKSQQGHVTKRIRRKASKPHKNLSSHLQFGFEDIIDDKLWTKRKTCCGIVYECLIYDAVIVDAKTFVPCAQHSTKPHEVPVKITKVSDLMNPPPAAIKKHHMFIKRSQQDQMKQAQLEMHAAEQQKTEATIDENNATLSNKQLVKHSDKFLHKLQEGGKISKNGGKMDKASLKTKIGNGLSSIIKCGGNDNSSDSGYDEIAVDSSITIQQKLAMASTLMGLSQSTPAGTINLNHAKQPTASSSSGNGHSAEFLQPPSLPDAQNFGTPSHLLIMKPKFLQQTAN